MEVLATSRTCKEAIAGESYTSASSSEERRILYGCRLSCKHPTQTHAFAQSPALRRSGSFNWLFATARGVRLLTGCPPKSLEFFFLVQDGCCRGLDMLLPLHEGRPDLSPSLGPRVGGITLGERWLTDNNNWRQYFYSTRTCVHPEASLYYPYKGGSSYMHCRRPGRLCSSGPHVAAASQGIEGPAMVACCRKDPI